MKTGERSISEVDELIRFAVSLVRAHYEPDENTDANQFKNECDELSKFLETIGKLRLATYIRVLCGEDKNVFVPM